MVWSVLNLLSCDTDLELNQHAAALDCDGDFIVPPLSLNTIHLQQAATTTSTTTISTTSTTSTTQQVQSPPALIPKQLSSPSIHRLSSPSLHRLSNRAMRDGPSVGSFESPRGNDKLGSRSGSKEFSNFVRSGSKEYGSTTIKRTSSKEHSTIKRAGSNKDSGVSVMGKEGGSPNVSRSGSKDYSNIYGSPSVSRNGSKDYSKSLSPAGARRKIKMEKPTDKQQIIVVEQYQPGQQPQQPQISQYNQQLPQQQQKIQSYQIPEMKSEPYTQSSSVTFSNFGARSNSKRMAFDLGPQCVFLFSCCFDSGFINLF